MRTRTVSRPPARLRLERLEDRTAPATFTVATAGDNGPGAFRQAILNANSAAGNDTVRFAILGSGTQTIHLLSTLPSLTDNAGVTMADLAARLVGRLSTPSHAAMRAELKRRVRAILDQLDPTDREILSLRHFEQLSNGETAAVLGLRESTTSMRYARALLKLKDVLTADEP